MKGGPSGYIGFRDTAKKCINFLNAGGKPRISSTDYMYDVTHGNIPDYRIAYKSYFLPIYHEITQNITIIRIYKGPMKFIEKTDIKLSAISDTASTIGLAEVRGWLEKN